MYWFLAISFLLGISCGSFLITAVFRLYKKKKLRGRSVCDHCGEKLRVRELIPIVSFFIRKGTCASCKERISSLYPLVELCTGALFAFIAYMHLTRGGEHAPSFMVRDWYIAWVLLFIFLYDALYMEVEDRIVIPAIVTVFVISGVFDWQTWTTMVWGALVGGGFFLIQYALSKGRWIGGGDILIGIFMGVVLGFPKVLAALFISYVLGALIVCAVVAWAVVKAAFSRERLSERISEKVPLGVYLSVGTFISLFWGEQFIHWYIRLW